MLTTGFNIAPGFVGSLYSFRTCSNVTPLASYIKFSSDVEFQYTIDRAGGWSAAESRIVLKGISGGVLTGYFMK